MTVLKCFGPTCVLLFCASSWGSPALRAGLQEKGLRLRAGRDATRACFQGGSTKDHCLQRVQQSLERYFYLVAFNYYLHEQVRVAGPPPSCRGRERRGGFGSARRRRGAGQGERAQADGAPPRPPAGSTPWALPSASAGGCAGTPSCTGCRRTSAPPSSPSPGTSWPRGRGCW